MTEHQARRRASMCRECLSAPTNPRKSWYCSVSCRLKANKHEDGDCWIWKQHHTSDGYGLIKIAGKSRLVHRVAYEELRGPVSSGLVVRHSCDRPACWNPDHLSLGTVADNNNDMRKRGRDARGERGRHAKLTEDIVRVVRSTPSISNAEWAIKLNVTIPAIYAIRKRKSWRHVG